MQTRKYLPWAMVMGRASLGPIVLIGERCGWSGITLAAMVLAALLSDVFDGVLARRWKTDTAALRLCDSLSDTAFYVCVALSIGLGMPDVWHHCRTGVLVVLTCEALRFAFDFLKFGKPASYHSYLAKAWGLVLAIATITTFVTQRISPWMSAAILLGVLSNAETLAMSLVLPVWRRDVKTLAVACRIRAELQCKRLQRTPVQATVVGVALVLGAAALGNTEVQAQSLQHVIYVGGTAIQGTGLRGKLSVSSADTLLFEGPSTLSIPYEQIISYESSSHRRVHVGLLAEAIWRLAAPWPDDKQLSLSYHDADNHAQVIVLEMSRGDETLLVEVLKTRVPRAAERHAASLKRPPVAGRGEVAVH